MKTRKLGKNGPVVSAIALGGMSFAGFYSPCDRAAAFATMDAAHQGGITFIDTAELYGRGVSETLIGEWQKERGKTFTIATKGGIVVGGKRGETDNSEPGLRRALEGSLTRLGVDHVTLYYVHRRDWSLPIETVTETLEGFRQEGLIKGFGFSEIAPASLRRAASVAHVMAVQNEYSLWTRYPDLGLIQACAELGTAFVPFSPLGRGILSDTDINPAALSDVDFRKSQPRFQEPDFTFNMAYVAALRDFAARRGWKTSAAALAWVLDQGPHLIPIPGTCNPAHLSEWIEASDIEFTEEDRAEFAEIMPVGWAAGDRYSDAQIMGIERYC